MSGLEATSKAQDDMFTPLLMLSFPGSDFIGKSKNRLRSRLISHWMSVGFMVLVGLIVLQSWRFIYKVAPG